MSAHTTQQRPCFVTRHGAERVRKRLGSPKKGVGRRIQQVINNGMPFEELRGQLKTVLFPRIERGKHYLLWSGQLHVFGHDWNFITCYPVNSYKNELARQLRAWKSRKVAANSS